MIGLCGMARSGKDSFFNYSKAIFGELGVHTVRVAFADALKEECNDFLRDNVGISSFTEDPVEKMLIRPFLVTYGTHLRRKINQSCWISKVKPKVNGLISSGLVPVITDVRYENEVEFVKKQGGVIIHISRSGVKPPNEEEKTMDPKLKKLADIKLSWPTLGDDEEGYTSYIKENAMENSNDLRAV